MSSGNFSIAAADLCGFVTELLCMYRILGTMHYIVMVYSYRKHSMTIETQVLPQEDLITKVSQIIPRADGSQVKIVVSSTMLSTGVAHAVSSYVLRRESESDNWKLCSDSMPEGWKMMPREDYIKFGRPERFRYASHAEVLKLTQLLGKPMSAMQHA